MNGEYEVKKDRPIPFIVSFSPVGLMHIGWTDKMKPPQNIAEIPPSLFAVKLDNIEQKSDSLGRRRRLDNHDEQAALFKTKDGSFEAYMKIVNALEVSVQS